MALWSPDDPHGVAILRKVLLTLVPGALAFGAYRSIVRDDSFGYYALASILFLIVGLFLEKARDKVSKRREE